MGVVYGAEDLNLGRQVALKVLSPHLIADPKARKRFLREAKAAAALDHPGICTVYEAGEVEGQLFIAMALLEGQTLQERIVSGPLSIDESLDIATQAAGALKEAHGKGIVHRDIKPANVMLLSSGQAKVMDFGLARLEGATQLTRTGTTLGTAAYMSPEQVRGELADARSDIWSLGVVLYEMVSGRLPFRGEYEPAVEYAIVHEEPELLTAVRPEATPELEDLVRTCLKKNPTERYQSADEFLADLGRLRSGAAQALPKVPAKSPTKSETRRMTPSRPTTLQGSSATAVQILDDRYRIERLLGRGGMGEVWLAFDLKLGVEVALKFLLPELASDPQRIALLRREVRTARNVASPHVCRVFDLIEIEGQELVSMEYVDGTTLQELLATQSPIDIVEARRIATQLLTGLQDIHNAGLIHRDLKPANVMITRSGRAVVMDFGLAKVVTDTQTVAVAGTPAYMAPEQMRGEELDLRTDLYAVGIILAEMVAPEGVRDSALRRKLWDGLRQDPPKAPPGPWEGAIRRAVAANRGERFASAAEMARALGDGGQRLSGLEELSPYPGLSSFTGDQAKFFFGRELDVESIWRKISRLSLAALIGPSGVGKSSFLRAGVIAAKPNGWNVAICTPGDNPFNSLGQGFLAEFAGQTDAMRDLFRLQDIDRAIPLLHGWRQRSKQALLIVDQFEELFTLNPPEVQSRFAELLGRLSVEADIHVLVSMRDDFFFLCHQYSALSSLFSNAMPLAPLAAKDLRRAIVEPARLCGFAFEDEALVDEMMAEVEGERGALPLVAFAAARLWDLRDREHGVITRHSYEEIGRVGGALAQHAEATLERIGHEREDLVREIFRNLVTAQHTRVVRERDELLSVFDDRATAEEVLKALIDARLLTSFEIAEAREGSKERHRIEVVHESLLTSWPRLVRWQTQDTDGAQLRDQLRQAAQLWKDRNQSDDLLWTGTAYKEFELWRERYPGGLTEAEHAFGEAMGARSRRDRRRRHLALGAVFAMLLSVIAVISWYGREQRLARLNVEADRLVDLGRAELDADPSVALAHAIAALERVDSPTNRRFALEAVSRGPTALFMPTSAEMIGGFSHFSPDGKRLAVGSLGGVQVFSHDGSPPVTLEDYYIVKLRDPWFAPDGDRVIWTDVKDQSVVRIWSLSQGKEVRTFRMEGPTWCVVRGEYLILNTRVLRGPSNDVVIIIRKWPFDDSDPEVVSSPRQSTFSDCDIDRDVQQVAYVNKRGVYLCPLDSFGESRGRLVGEHDFQASWLAFDPSGERIATADTTGEIRIWSVVGDSKRPLRVLRGEKPIRWAYFDPSGAMLAAMCGPKRRICLWDLNGPWGAEPLILRTKREDLLRGPFPQIAFDPTGDWNAATYKGGILFWPLARPDSYVLRGDSRGFAPDGQVLFGVDNARRFQVQSLEGGEPRSFLNLEFTKNLVQTEFDPLGKYMAVSTNGDGAFVVSLADGKARQLPDSPPGGLFGGGMAFSSDGRFVAGSRWDADKAIRVWDLEADTVRVLEQSKGMTCWSHAFSEDGRLFTGDLEGNLLQWNIQDGSSTVILKSALPVIQYLAVTRDSRFLLALFESSGGYDEAYRSEIRLFDLENHTSRLIATHGNKVSWCVLDSTKTLLVTASEDKTIRVGPITGEEPHIILLREKHVDPRISPDGRWISAALSTDAFSVFSVFRVPEGRPMQTLPHDEFLDRLRAMTNLRVVPDKASQTGYRLDTAPFPGWEKVPTR